MHPPDDNAPDVPRVIPRALRSGPRGTLVEILRARDVHRATFGQIYAVSILPGAVSGNHYHERKHEWFFPLLGSGYALIRERSASTDTRIPLDASTPTSLYVPPLFAHAIVNTGQQPLVIVAHISEEFDESDPDTIPLMLVP